MKETKTYEMQGMKEMWNEGSYEVGYCRLTVIDATGKITQKNVDELFVAFKEGWFEKALETFSRKYKKLKFQSEECEGYQMKVTITNRKL